MKLKPKRRVIEDLIPLQEIGIESSKSVARGDIHAIHTWFARRPLAACRAATFAALVNAPERSDEMDHLQLLIKRGLLNSAPDQDPCAIDEMRRQVASSNGDTPPRVLDPFGGGGSLPLEAARLGAEAHAIDLNPVAVLTMLATVDFPFRFANTEFPVPESSPAEVLFDSPSPGTGTVTGIAKAVRRWSDWVYKYASERIERFYTSESGSVIVAFFWAKTVECTNPSCGHQIPMLAHRWLSKRANKPPMAYRIKVDGSGGMTAEILEGDEAEADNPSEGTMARASTRCPHCSESLKPDQVKAQASIGKTSRWLFAIAEKSERGVQFRSSHEADTQAFSAASRELNRRIGENPDPFESLVPDEEMPPRRAYGIYPQLYAVTTWGQMHNARQQLALVVFTEAIREAHKAAIALGADPEAARAVTLYLALMVSRMVIRLSEGSIWDNSGDKIQRATAGHKLPMTWDYAEANPFSGASSSWQSTVDWGVISLERIQGKGVPATVAWGDATKLPFPDASFDAVLTDPPYYDSVPYSYLSDMQYVWLKRALRGIFPDHFPGSLTPKQTEIIQDRARHASDSEAKEAFEILLRQALAEANRVLKPDGLAMFMYAHTATSAWETLVSALIDAGFQVTASWPVNTETTSRRDWLGGAVLQATILLVCRKRSRGAVGYMDTVVSEMRNEMSRALTRYWAADIGGADFFISAIGPALSVFSRFDYVRYPSGQTVSISNFLVQVRQAVVDFSLQRALKGSQIGVLDPYTQFALLWRWTYGHQQVETGAARLLDKATGVELEELSRTGLLKALSGGKKMVLLEPHERPELLTRTLRSAVSGKASAIDVIHCAALLWRDGRKQELADLLASQPPSVRLVAQALAELQKDGRQERRLVLGMLSAWQSISQTNRRTGNEQLELGINVNNGGKQ